MARTLTQQRGDKPHDPDSRYGIKTGASPRNPLDSDAMRDLASQFENFWTEARDHHAENRVQRFIDHDYYDHEQISPEDMAVYEERGQAPVVQNLVHGAVDWLSGTERRTRIDWKINPRGPEDTQGAEAQTHLMKYVSDANRAGWERSRAFKDAVISGVGFVEEFLRQDESQEAVGFGYVDWRYLWWDPYSRDYDFGDARYFHRAKFVDLDRAIAMCPDRAGDLQASAVSSVDNDFVLMDRLDGVPAMYALSSSGLASSYLASSGGIDTRAPRRRVRMIETWYRRPQVSKKVKALIVDYSDLEGVTYDATNAELKEKLDKGYIGLTDSLTEKMAMAIWVPGVGICKQQDSPYQHNQFPFSAAWAYRHHRDGMPYGIVRGLRDSQDEYNKRRAKALYAASVQRVLYEEDAFDEDDEREMLDEIGRMNGEVKLAPGGLKKIQIDTGVDVSAQHVIFQQQAKDHIYEGSGITKENLGQDTGALSGRAIVAKQQQGSVTTAELFDLFRLFIEISGQKLLSNIRIGMSAPKQIRIVGKNADGDEGFEWLAVNQPVFDPDTGKVTWENDILNTLSDFKVGEQDFRETLRMAMAESLFEVIGKLPPEVAIQLLDLAVELTDIPNKQKFIDRIQKASGVQATPVDPDAQAAADAQAALAQRDADLSAEERAAKIEKDRAQAEKLRADAKKAVLEGKGQALNTVGMVQAALPMATSADELYAGALATPPQPVPAGVIPQ